MDNIEEDPRTMPELLTARQVCDELGLSSTTLDRWIAAGDIVIHRKLPGLRGPRLFTADHIKRVRTRRDGKQS